MNDHYQIRRVGLKPEKLVKIRPLRTQATGARLDQQESEKLLRVLPPEHEFYPQKPHQFLQR